MSQSRTRDYKKFGTLPFNRDFGPTKELVDSFNEFGWLAPVLVFKMSLFGKNLLWILDGQHRFATAKYLKLPIEYWTVGFKFKDLPTIVRAVAKLNAVARKWNNSDYIHAFCYLGYEDYAYINEIHNQTKISHLTLAALYSGEDRSYAGRVIKSGDFKVTRKDEGDQLIEYIGELSNIIPFSNRMILGFRDFHNSLGSFNFKKFAKNLEKNLPLLIDVSETDAFHRIFDKIYNK